MALNVAQKLIRSHLVGGEVVPGAEIAPRVDQVLLQDVLGTSVMLELEAMGLDRVAVEPAVRYVDHNLVQNDTMNADEHLFLRSARRRFGVWYSRPGNGISHPVHMARFGEPGASLVGSDSHTPAAGSLGMLAFGAGGVEVALAMAGQPLHLRMPQIWGVRSTGRLPDWVSAKDVILEMLRPYGVEGGFDRIIEYHGPGLDLPIRHGQPRHRQHGRRTGPHGMADDLGREAIAGIAGVDWRRHRVRLPGPAHLGKPSPAKLTMPGGGRSAPSTDRRLIVWSSPDFPHSSCRHPGFRSIDDNRGATAAAARSPPTTPRALTPVGPPAPILRYAPHDPPHERDPPVATVASAATTAMRRIRLVQ